MKNAQKNIIFFSGFSLFALLAIIILSYLAPEPPVKEMEYARETLSSAGMAHAGIYSKRNYTQAKTYYDSAMFRWQQENRKFLFLRNYEKVRVMAELSVKEAKKAEENSSSTASQLKIKLQQKINDLNYLVSNIDEQFNTYPLTSEIRSRISKGRLLLKEAEIAYEKEQYPEANRKIIDSEYLLYASNENATINLKEYFNSYSVWKSWIIQTIDASEVNRDYSIIVDKYSRKLYIYYNGNKKYEFEAELGKNWVGNKRIKGDKATPEGIYKIIKKLDSGKTKYYKALLLNYPNEEDIRKFRQDLANGSLPSDSRIGGLIEIHGNGGKGIDWTEGCIALTDSEMDLVFRITKVGTPVTIVGSMVDLDSAITR